MRLLVFVALGVCLFMQAACGGDARDALSRITDKPEYQRWKSYKFHEDRKNIREQYDSDDDEDDYREKPAPKREYSRRYEENDTPGSVAGFSGLFKFLGYLLLVVTVVFIAFSIFQHYREGREVATEKKKPPVAAAKALADGDALALDGSEWDRETERLLRQGDIRLAYRALYLGLLSELHSQGRIVFSRNRTNWQYVRSYKGESAMRREFADLTDVFDQVWYGLVPISGDGEIRSLASRIARLLSQGGA